MTPQQDMEMAREFILAQKSLEACYTHLNIRHHLSKQGIQLKKYLRGEMDVPGPIYSVVHGGEESQIRSIAELIQFLR